MKKQSVGGEFRARAAITTFSSGGGPMSGGPPIMSWNFPTRCS